MDRLSKQINFINEIEKLKTVKRQNLTLDNKRQENSAEHSWHLALMAMTLIEQCQSEEVNQLRVIKMLLLHDLVEIYAGDAFLYDEVARNNANVKEKLALIKLVSLLPSDQAKEFTELWNEFELGETEDAKFAGSLDALQPLLNHLITAPDNYNPHNIHVTKVMQKKAFVKLNTPKLWSIVEDTITKSVEKGLYI